MSILTGLLEASGGRVYFDGADTADHLLEYKARIGYVPEEAHLYSHLTGTEYLTLDRPAPVAPESSLRRRIGDSSTCSA